MAKHMITTIDNPFNPAENFRQWWLWDEVYLGHKTCGKIADIAQIDDNMSEEEISAAKEYAIDRIIELDFEKIYKKIEVS